MSLHPLLQTAPELSGIIDDPDLTTAWNTPGGTSTSVPTMSGTYIGMLDKTYTFTCDAGGTIDTTDTITVSWDDGEGNTGILNLGESHDYDAGDVIYVHDGISVAFAAGTCVATDVFTVGVTAARRLPADAQAILGNHHPVAIALASTDVDDRDQFFRTHTERRFRDARAMLRNPNLTLDWLDETNRKKFLQMKHNRHRVTFAENYSDDTVFLWRGRGGSTDYLLPIVGQTVFFSRTGTGTYRDPADGIYKSQGGGIPLPAEGLLGDGLNIQSAVVIQYLPLFHARSGTPAWAAASGSGHVISFDTNVLPPLDPNDDYWDSDVVLGTQKIYLPNNASVANASAGAGVAGTTYTGHVLLKGMGKVTLNFRSGSGTPSAVQASEVYTINSNDWAVYRVTGVVDTGHNSMDMELLADNNGPCLLWASACQIEGGSLVSSYIQTLGSAPATQNAETCYFTLQMPRPGTLSFWFYMPDHDETTSYFSLVEATLNARFAVRYNVANELFQFYTDSGGALASSPIDRDDMKEDWHHVAVTWEHDADNPGQMLRVIYYDGDAVGSDSTTNWDDDWEQSFTITKSLGLSKLGFRFAEIRVDGVVRTASEISDWYDRLTEEQWMHYHREFSGRIYELDRASEVWLHPVHPDKYIASANLTEVDFLEGNMVLER